MLLLSYYLSTDAKMPDRLVRIPSRQALSEFLRALRKKTTPESLGLPPARRRRTPGLRREEVAALAGVGLTWYTWFEQGRDITVSEDFLRRIARGLRLGRAEQEHLFALAGRPSSPSETVEPTLPHALRSMILALDQPAYIMSQSWDILAYNSLAAELFEDLESEQPNLLRIVFFSRHYKTTVADWQSAARLVLLKARHDYLTRAETPRLRVILDEILERIPQATGWWDDPEILKIGDVELTFHNEIGDRKSYQLSILVSESRPDLRVVVYNPV